MAAPKHRSRFLSTPSARRATLGGVCFFLCAVISIHALCEEGDVSAPFIKHSHKIFLSTPSARRATGEQRAPVARSQISIHALCEEGDRLLWDEPKIFFLISIHALCEEGDR